MEKRAFYTGCLGGKGHYFWLNNWQHEYDTEDIMKAVPDFIRCWAEIWDGGLLKNSKTLDVYTGRVFAVPAKGPWTALIWWDRSVDTRPGSNSGFYVSGFEWSQKHEALVFAQLKWPQVWQRQQHPLRIWEGEGK